MFGTGVDSEFGSVFQMMKEEEVCLLLDVYNWERQTYKHADISKLYC